VGPRIGMRSSGGGGESLRLAILRPL
jgi:hypothetical protein